jgi:hypothetical protein
MKFFMTGIEDSDRAEETYVGLAKEKGCSVVPADQRIQAIAFEHSASVTYVAEVGKHRRGYRKVKPKRRADPWPRPEEFESGGVVAAIIEGSYLPHGQRCHPRPHRRRPSRPPGRPARPIGVSCPPPRW